MTSREREKCFDTKILLTLIRRALVFVLLFYFLRTKISRVSNSSRWKYIFPVFTFSLRRYHRVQRSLDGRNKIKIFPLLSTRSKYILKLKSEKTLNGIKKKIIWNRLELKTVCLLFFRATFSSAARALESLKLKLRWIHFRNSLQRVDVGFSVGYTAHFLVIYSWRHWNLASNVCSLVAWKYKRSKTKWERDDKLNTISIHVEGEEKVTCLICTRREENKKHMNENTIVESTKKQRCVGASCIYITFKSVYTTNRLHFGSLPFVNLC